MATVAFFEGAGYAIRTKHCKKNKSGAVNRPDFRQGDSCRQPQEKKLYFQALLCPGSDNLYFFHLERIYFVTAKCRTGFTDDVAGGKVYGQHDNLVSVCPASDNRCGNTQHFDKR